MNCHLSTLVSLDYFVVLLCYLYIIEKSSCILMLGLIEINLFRVGYKLLLYMLKGFLMKMQNFFMQCKFQQWRPQFDDWYIFCFRIESFPNNSKNIIACLYIHISLCCSLTYYINILSVASVIFCRYYPKSDVIELKIMLISAWLMEIQLLLEGITKRFKFGCM